MDGLNTIVDLDTEFLKKVSHLPDELYKAARRALVLTNRWFRLVTLAETGKELRIDSKAMKTRFRVYKKGGQSKLWVGVRSVGVHRIGKPEQMKDGVQVGDHFFDKAFISPMNSSELLVWRRTGEHDKSLERVDLDVADEAEEIIGSYMTELNRKFEEYFYREFQHFLSSTK